MTIPCPYEPNGKIIYKERVLVPKECDPETGEPIFDTITQEIPVWLELNIRGDARHFDGDESSEFTRMNLVGRAFGILPPNITQLTTVEVELFTQINGISRFPAQVFPRVTTAMRFPTLLLGDPIRVVAKDKSFNRKAEEGEEYDLV